MTPAGLGGCIIELMERGPDRLRDQHRREPLSRPALRAELHAAPRLAVRRRSRALRRRRDPHLRRAVPGARCCSIPTRFIREFLVHERHGRPGVDRRAARRARPAPVEACARAARATRWSPPRRSYGVPIYTSSPGDSSIGMNIAYHELINRSTLHGRSEQGRQRGVRDHPAPARRTAA